MNCLAKASRTIISGLALAATLSLSTFAQTLTAGFSMMETATGVNSLIKGTLVYRKKDRTLQWAVTYPKAQTLTIPAAAKPSAEEEATLSLYDRYTVANGFAESQIRKASGWKKQNTVQKEGAVAYHATDPKVNAVQRYVGGNLYSSVLTLPDGRQVMHIFSKYSNQAGIGTVPMEVTTILTDKGKRTYKRLMLKGLALKK